MKSVCIVIISVAISLLGSFYIHDLEKFSQPVLENTPSENKQPEIKKNDYLDSNLENQIIDLVDEVSESVVSIVTSRDITYVQDPYAYYFGSREDGVVATGTQQLGGGSGMIIHEDGYILTNKHVVEDQDVDFTVLFSNGDSAIVDTIWTDPSLDIAIIKVKDQEQFTFTPVSLYPLEKTTKKGQFTIAIGNALAEFEQSVTFGIVSGKNRRLTLDQENLYAGLIQTDASISQGNSGGPLFDLQGKVIGVNTAISTEGENIGFAIPISNEFIATTLASIIKHNEIRRPFVGVQYVDITKQYAKQLEMPIQEGIYIADVVDGSPAQEAGIVQGDSITHIYDIQITQEFPFLYQLFTYLPGNEIEITMQRDGEEIKKTLILGTK